MTILPSGLWVPDIAAVTWDVITDPPADRRPLVTQHVTIRRNADGEVRVAHLPNSAAIRPDPDGYPDYYWSDGNASCDCNRARYWHLGDGSEAPEDTPCGDDGYTVLSITQDDDPTVVYAEEPSGPDPSCTGCMPSG